MFEVVSIPLLLGLTYIGYIDRRLLAGTLMGLVTSIGSILALFTMATYLSDIQRVCTLVNSPLYGPSLVILVILMTWVYATKVPSWPIYTWLMEAHVEVSSEVSLLLAGSVLKLGLIGSIKIVTTYHLGSSIEVALL